MTGHNLLQDSGLPDLAKGLVSDALEEGYSKGRSGWQTDSCSDELLQNLCQQALDNGEWHKVACYATMIATREGARIL